MSGPGRSRRAWGWYRLVDEWAERIVTDAEVRPGELVVDIGAGQGALTGYLVEAGARVLAVQRHPGRARWLQERFAAAPVTVIQADARSLSWPRRRFRVVASPPYAISSALLRVLLGSRSALTWCCSGLWCAATSSDGAPTTRHLHRRWDARMGRALPRHAFRPAPQGRFGCPGHPPPVTAGDARLAA